MRSVAPVEGIAEDDVRAAVEDLDAASLLL